MLVCHIFVCCTLFTENPHLFPGFFKGTSAEQDRRFSDKETKLLKSMKFPSEFDRKV
jgi:serine/arginine repetitive matrix protein 1